ncbi:MAG TPA: alpha/beta fold hydrolase, partial [Caulobacteraceae bacterium]|nr:alpha/beta fold hydrolase [Caulobacteraceae bacterium]
MGRGAAIFLGVVLASTLVGVTAAAPLDAYGQLPSIESVAVSPDGKMLAIALTNGESRRIVVRHTHEKTPLTILDGGTQKIREIQWAGDHHLLISISTTGDIAFAESARTEKWTAIDFDLATQKQRSLLNPVNTTLSESLNLIYGEPKVRMVGDRLTAFVVGMHFIYGEGKLAVFKVDLERQATTLEAAGRMNSLGFAFGPKGVVAEDDYDGGSGDWALRKWGGGTWDLAAHQSDLEDPPQLLGVGRDGVSPLVRFRTDHEPWLGEVKTKDAAPDRLPMADADDLIQDNATGRLIGLYGLYGDESRYLFFDPHDEQLWKAIVAAYPGQRVELAGFDDARDVWIVTVESPTDGPAWAVVDLAAKKASWIGNTYDRLNAPDISPVRAIAFKAQDGFGLSGYLTTPRDGSKPDMPLVVLVHGGPAVRDTPAFDWWSQALASRGYAVLRINYRGSSGFDWKQQQAGFGQMGRKMQTDLSDGVRYLVSQNIVDAKRVCIVGASYGGYAALAGAALDKGVYRCAASIAGPSDLARMISWDKSRESAADGAYTNRYWRRYMGEATLPADISPAFHADQVTIPILLMHGKDDTVVDYQQSQIMADALGKAGKPYEFVTLAGEDHWLSRGATRIQMLKALVDFLQKNNPTDAPSDVAT